MHMFTVDSSNIHSVGYEVYTSTLHIKFNHDPSVTYCYYDVPRKIFVDLLAVDSVGKYFAANVRNSYRFDKTKYAG